MDISSTHHSVSEKEAKSIVSGCLALNKLFRKADNKERLMAYYHEYLDFIDYNQEIQKVQVQLNGW